MIAIDTRRDLIEACLRNERGAQKQLYGDYADAMYNICYRMLQNHAEAEDVLQMAFVQIFKNLKQFKFQSTPGSWIKRIVVNTCITFCRSKKMRFVDIDEQADVTDDEPEEESQYDVKMIREAYEKLPAGYRTVLSLYLFEGYDHNEISDILDISVSTSKTQYHRAKKKLKEIMIKEYNY